MRFELMTSSLPRMRSTPELHRLFDWSGRRGSNSRPSAWKADALPTELLPRMLWEEVDSNHRTRRSGFTVRRNCRYAILPSLLRICFRDFEPMEGVEPTTPRLQITCSGQLSYIGDISMNVPFHKGIAKIGIYLDYPKLFQLFLSKSLLSSEYILSVSSPQSFLCCLTVA